MARYHTTPDGNIPFTAEEESARDAEEATADAATAELIKNYYKIDRKLLYQAEADPLFFEEQAGEVAAGTWAAKRAEIKTRYPKDVFTKSGK